jgi:cytochrome c oxidase assembly protein subunit 15
MTASASHFRAIQLWLYAVAGLIVLMVVVGGATRLTDSGLSIVEWRPVTGTIPPLSEADWLVEFDKYKTSSEYELANKGMSLAAFKRIFWWEWGHRLLGRVIGLVFLVPFLFFLYRGWIEARLRWRLWGIFALGGLQGGIGWWMVASGLVGRVDVAHERLAAHLVMASLILIALVWTAGSIAPPRPVDRPPGRIARGATALLVLLVVQIAL